MLNNVVLPAPFGPIMAKISPAGISNDTASSAVNPPNAMPRFSTRRIVILASLSGTRRKPSRPPRPYRRKRRHDPGAQKDHEADHDGAEDNVLIVMKHRKQLR